MAARIRPIIFAAFWDDSIDRDDGQGLSSQVLLPNLGRQVLPVHHFATARLFRRSLKAHHVMLIQGFGFLFQHQPRQPRLKDFGFRSEMPCIHLVFNKLL